jgi:hypothetical protein
LGVAVAVDVLRLVRGEGIGRVLGGGGAGRFFLLEDPLALDNVGEGGGRVNLPSML